MKKMILVLTLSVLTACSSGQGVAQAVAITLPAGAVVDEPSAVPAETTTPIPAATRVPEQAVFALVDGTSGFLLGGVQNGGWLSADRTASALLGGEAYRIFNATAYLGAAVGQRAETIEAGPCTQNYTVALASSEAVVQGIVVGGGWDVAPRTVTRLAPDEEDKATIASLLMAQGIADPEASIISVLQVDLEGDGVDEVLITAIRMTSGGIFPPVSAGDYSLVVLQKVVDGTLVTIPLVLDVYLVANELAYPGVTTITGVYDLNGDGRLDVLLQGKYWESYSLSVMDIEEDRAAQVLNVFCGE